MLSLGLDADVRQEEEGAEVEAIPLAHDIKLMRAPLLHSVALVVDRDAAVRVLVNFVRHEPEGSKRLGRAPLVLGRRNF